MPGARIVISNDRPLILASKSPRRKQLLKQARIPFKALPAGLKENHEYAEPGSLPLTLAELKAIQISKQASGNWVLGADTIVVIDNRMLGKPLDEEDARLMLEKLSGRTHKVITGFCLVDPTGEKRHSEGVVTKVKFKTLTKDEIEGYIKTGEPFGKAGSYAIQGIGAFLVESINGPYTNVVGLPLCALIKALVSVGALPTFPLLCPA